MKAEELTARINELYHKSKAEGLTEEEKEEQARLRQEYIENVRANLRGQLSAIRIQNEDGSITDLGKEHEDRKRVLRKEALLLRDALTASEREQKSRQIAEQLFRHPWYQEASCLLVYASYRSEVSTEEIIRYSLRNGKKVCCPVVTGKHEMAFYILDDRLSDEILLRGIDAMKKGSLGIPEPDADTCTHYVYEPQNSLMLMPGCAFDDLGNRIGYGGGFYDRYLAQQPMRTIALFFECQHCAEKIEREIHDVKPERILTENGFWPG